MRRIGQCNKPGHQNNDDNFCGSRRREHPDHGGDNPAGDNGVGEHLQRRILHNVHTNFDERVARGFIKYRHILKGPRRHSGTNNIPQ
ncbi:hypothetical protein D1872_322900 [compost metagenome]